MITIIKVEILEATQDNIKFFKDRTVEESIEIITEMTVITEIQVGVDLEKGYFLEMPVTEEMIGAQVIVGLDPVQ